VASGLRNQNYLATTTNCRSLLPPPPRLAGPLDAAATETSHGSLSKALSLIRSLSTDPLVLSTFFFPFPAMSPSISANMWSSIIRSASLAVCSSHPNCLVVWLITNDCRKI
jgi:hypothetical protein